MRIDISSIIEMAYLFELYIRLFTLNTVHLKFYRMYFHGFFTMTGILKYYDRQECLNLAVS
ncbi:MAG: hypothetical protein J07HQW2_01394 [Haloquadratum walsbyi J07HQW2]|uniref:Uncharacterized protein n=1 Tax=Haloquadratum walsbyi J07HQW2 TaxID=1238425 RepID=U1PMJ4_9EURY|nr:MAG: hypothetical protein J07HQW2_01394 [Haloquadratum walsbyi J07HQW2]